MFKLLTDEERAKVRGEYARRRAIVLLLATATVFFIGSISLLPSYLISGVRLEEAHSRLESLAHIKNIEPNPEVWLKNINLKLRTLAPGLDTGKPSEVFEEVVSRRGEGVTLESFAWTSDGTKSTLRVTGIANDRETLIAFRDRIVESKLFISAVLPFSNLAENEDINFQMELTPDMEAFKNKPEVEEESND